jgi:DNA polymerase-3 subunit beta
VSLLTDENSRAVKLSFSDGKLQLMSSTPEAGDAEINIAAGYKGELFSIGFNAQYLLDVLRVVTEPEVKCHFTEPGRPGVIKSGKNFLHVIMPVSV